MLPPPRSKIAPGRTAAPVFTENNRATSETSKWFILGMGITMLEGGFHDFETPIKRCHVQRSYRDVSDANHFSFTFFRQQPWFVVQRRTPSERVKPSSFNSQTLTLTTQRCFVRVLLYKNGLAASSVFLVDYPTLLHPTTAAPPPMPCDCCGSVVA